jgi:DNA-binding winged helix-turn-helix (wHTH) protein/TolB-like protein/Flp pilus assembly protein TadD
MSKANRQIYAFDNFRLDAGERILARDGEPVTLPAKAFDLLVVLLENNGRLVGKDELYQRVWTDQIVEESNLTVQMSALRKALGERRDNPRYIVTVPGHGYRFIGEVIRVGEGQEVGIEAENQSHIVIEKKNGQMANDLVPSLPLDIRDHQPISETPSTITATAEMQRTLPVNPTRKWVRVLAVAVILCGSLLVGFYFWSKRTAPTQLPSPRQIKALAVLPFKPLVTDDRDESLELGMADTLIARLANLREINVRPIGAVRKYVGLDQDAVAAGREQRVDAVVDGHMQKSGDKIRVTVRLVRVEDGATLWTNHFDEKLTDIFQVQDSISERVAGLLAQKLTGEEQERLTRHPTENTEAYQLYLLGRYHLNRLTDDGFQKGLEYFQLAVEKDPNFALAYAGMADAYNQLAGFNVRPPREVFPKARSAAVAALNLDPQLAQAHTELAMVNLTFDWDWPVAEKEFQRAIEINPSDSDAHYYYAYYFTFMGKFDNGITEIRKALELDPVSLVKLTGVAQVLLMARHYDEAIEECRKALEMDPNLGYAHWLLGLAYMYKGSYEQAILALQKSIPLSADSPDEPATLAKAYALSGRPTEARKIFDELKQQSRHRYISPGTLADLYWAIGQKDEAFAMLNKAIDERDNMVVLLKVEPMFDPLRSDPRFTNLLRRVGFPQ